MTHLKSKQPKLHNANIRINIHILHKLCSNK
nr:MAG TPA: hypothetical protein [Caudoviricetes sp.]DAX76152.1 MAG TPA: hypothetical protein [Caudoviricetes sp.]